MTRLLARARPLRGRLVTEMRLHRREVKTALRRRDLVDSYFVGKPGFSPYQACAHRLPVL